MGTPLVHHLPGDRGRRDDGLLRGVPSRLIGATPPKQSKRDKLAGTAVGGALSATVCTRPYLLRRLGILMVGSSAGVVFVLGLLALALGITLQAGATGAVRAIKMTATLTAAGIGGMIVAIGPKSALRAEQCARCGLRLGVAG